MKELANHLKDINPLLINVKENKKSIVVSTHNYSSHSSVFDSSFRLAKKLGIKFKGVQQLDSLNSKPYKIKFYK